MGGLGALLALYGAQFRVTIANQFQYRGALIIWLIGLVLEPTVYLVVWATVANSGGGQVGGYTAGDFAAYFIALMLVNHATFTWIMWQYEFDIRMGHLSPKLLRPVHPIHRDIAENLTYKMLTLMLILPLALALVLVFRPTAQTQLWNLLAFVPALLLAILLRFTIEWTFAIVAFWITRMRAVQQIYYTTFLFLAGQIAPLALFPPPVQTLATFMPFRWTLAFPVELVLGRLTPTDTLIGLGAQATWLGISIVVLNLVWRAGVKRYSAVGA